LPPTGPSSSELVIREHIIIIIITSIISKLICTFYLCKNMMNYHVKELTLPTYVWVSELTKYNKCFDYTLPAYNKYVNYVWKDWFTYMSKLICTFYLCENMMNYPAKELTLPMYIWVSELTLHNKCIDYTLHTISKLPRHISEA
jgi:hypothetical protein